MHMHMHTHSTLSHIHTHIKEQFNSHTHTHTHCHPYTMQMMRHAETDSSVEHYEVGGVKKESSELQKYRFKSTYERTHSTEQEDKYG